MSDTLLCGGEVWVNANRMGGAPCFYGTRITVDAVRSLLVRGYSDGEVQELYPVLTPQQIAVARRFVDDVSLPDETETIACEPCRLRAERIQEAVRLLRHYGDGGAMAALRVLEGEADGR